MRNPHKCCSEYLQTYARFPQTARIFFGGTSVHPHTPKLELILFEYKGGHDNGYLPTLTALQSEHLLNKLVILQGYSELAYEIRALSLPSLNVENLFRPTKLLNSPRKQSAPMSPLLLDGVVGGSSLFTRPGGSTVSSGSLGTFDQHDLSEPLSQSMNSKATKKLNPFVVCFSMRISMVHYSLTPMLYSPCTKVRLLP